MCFFPCFFFSQTGSFLTAVRHSQGNSLTALKAQFLSVFWVDSHWTNLCYPVAISSQLSLPLLTLLSMCAQGVLLENRKVGISLKRKENGHMFSKNKMSTLYLENSYQKGIAILESVTWSNIYFILSFCFCFWKAFKVTTRERQGWGRGIDLSSAGSLPPHLELSQETEAPNWISTWVAGTQVVNPFSAASQAP